MTTLNLAKKETSSIEFEVSHFPDGQQDVKILKMNEWERYPNAYKEIQIKSRFNSFKDLELIICATKALKRAGVEEIHLYIPYLLGARSDRKFVDGGTSYLVDIVAPILNSQNYKSVVTLDAHSDVAAACINNLKVEDNKKLVRFALHDAYGPNTPDKFVLVSPDAGSLKKIYKVADQIGYRGEYIICSKYRNWEGKLSRVEVPIRTGHIQKDFIIIDDICDGGRTFVEIAKMIKEEVNKYKGIPGKVYLIVTHGIFSARFKELGEYFDKIYCTNSYSDLTFSEWGLEADELRQNEKDKTLIKQLDVF